MPLMPLRYMQERAAHPTEYALPDERVVPLLGSARRPTVAGRLLTNPLVHAEGLGKMGHVQVSAFVDEMAKISHVPNTEEDKAGVLRAMLLTLMGRPVHVPPGESSYLAQEQGLLYGGEEGRSNYAQAVQADLASQLMRDTQLRSTMEAMQHQTSRTVGS